MQYNQVTERFSIQTARMLDRMASIDERRSSLLDNSLVLFGSGMKDGNAHESVNVPTALFGNPGGKLETGRHIQCKEGSKLAQFTPINPLRLRPSLHRRTSTIQNYRDSFPHSQSSRFPLRFARHLAPLSLS